MTARIRAFVPTAILALLALWCGTFSGAASSVGALAHQGLLLAVCLLAPEIRDPLQLGRSGRWLLPAVLSVAAISAWSSPVGRAGFVGLALLPAYVLVPAVVAHCWRQPQLRRLGLISLSAVTLTVSTVALIRWQTEALARASLPLGHHNLLAGWLVLVLPMTLAAGRSPGLGRGLAIAGGGAGLVTLAATGSLLGTAAVAVQALLASLWCRRLRPWLIPGLLTVVAVGLPRLLTMAQSQDLSALARLAYLRGGWQGVAARPSLGWGPGSVPWTIGGFLHPEPGVHPASQIVGDLHSLPLQLTYEIGLTGLALTLGICLTFGFRRRLELAAIDSRTTKKAALLGLAGGAFFALGSAPTAVPALPYTAALVAGAALAAPAETESRWRLPVLGVYLLAATILLANLDRAHLLYDRARTADSPVQSRDLIARAHEIDPGFPLYEARQAWLSAELDGASGENAGGALAAARKAPGLAPLWLAAGDLGRRSGQPWAPEALTRAREIDPLSPLIAFHLMMVDEASDERQLLGEIALSGEPRLAGALWWSEHREIAVRVGRRTGLTLPIPVREPTTKPQTLALTLDYDPALSFSLFAFRRSPWPGRLLPTAVRLPADETSIPPGGRVESAIE